jgi:hypothetical protein
LLYSPEKLLRISGFAQSIGTCNDGSKCDDLSPNKLKPNPARPAAVCHG